MIRGPPLKDSVFHFHFDKHDRSVTGRTRYGGIYISEDTDIDTWKSQRTVILIEL